MFRPLPNGSSSLMEDLTAGSTARAPYSNLFVRDPTRENIASFDKALSAFVVCVYELAERAGISASLPCRIQGASVMGMSMCLTGNSVEKWTQAVQFLFRSLKRVVEHVSNTYISLY